MPLYSKLVVFIIIALAVILAFTRLSNRIKLLFMLAIIILFAFAFVTVEEDLYSMLNYLQGTAPQPDWLEYYLRAGN